MNIIKIMKNVQKQMKVLLILLAGAGSFSALATPVFDFQMSGNTFYRPFSISNFSTNGEFIKSFVLDISGLGIVFDTTDNDGGSQNSIAFTPIARTGTRTGALSTSGAADNSTTLRAFFSDFNAGEKFLFDIDLDRVGDERSSVYGNDLIGSLLTVEFSDGMFLSGKIVGEAGNPTVARLTLDGTNFALSVNSPGTLALFALIPLILVSNNRSKKRQLTK